MYLLSKLLPLLVLPLGVSLLLLLWGVWRRTRWCLWAGVLVLLVSSNPLVAQALFRAAEGWQERVPAAAAPVADVIVVLSAGRVVAPGPARVSEWGESNRFFAGIELFRAGKAPVIVFTGGPTSSDPVDPSEGAVLAGYARDFGVPADRVLVTTRVMNTADEAVAVAALLAARGTPSARVLLVTSAFHMPRAERLFRLAGVSVVPFRVDFGLGQGDGSIGILDVMPSVGALGLTHMAMREWYGRTYYWLRGL